MAGTEGAAMTGANPARPAANEGGGPREPAASRPAGTGDQRLPTPPRPPRSIIRIEPAAASGAPQPTDAPISALQSGPESPALPIAPETAAAGRAHRAPDSSSPDAGPPPRRPSGTCGEAAAQAPSDPTATPSATDGETPPRQPPQPSEAAAPGTERTAQPVDAPRAAAAPRRHTAGLQTARAGLLFLLPVLLRLGLPAWAARHDADAAAWAAAVLRCALQRVQAAPDEPWFDLLAAPALPAAPATACPDLWATPALAPPRGRPGPTLVDAWSAAATAPAQAAQWLDASRRWLRRGPHIGLASLLRRPGSVSWSPTHVDVHLPMSAADLRVRRHGLDIDPGWLPWFGRVVAFHYTSDGA
jgi:hypothetical protein